MKFEVRCNDSRQSCIAIYLDEDGKVWYSRWEFEGGHHGYPDDEPSSKFEPSPLDNFISALDRVANESPEVYRAVYEHIQCRTECAYRKLADHCKRKNNEYIHEFTRKFHIIE